MNLLRSFITSLVMEMISDKSSYRGHKIWIVVCLCRWNTPTSRNRTQCSSVACLDEVAFFGGKGGSSSVYACGMLIAICCKQTEFSHTYEASFKQLLLGCSEVNCRKCPKSLLSNLSGAVKQVGKALSI